MTIFKACDVRGVVGTDWGAEEAETIGRSLASMLRRRNQLTIVIGGDFRRSTPELKSALTKGLCGAGISVVDVGQVPTPMVQFAARESQCPNFAIVTASHNPGQYNGIKFQIDGSPPTPDLIQELQEGCSASSEISEAGRYQQREVTDQYGQWVRTASRMYVDRHLTRDVTEPAEQGRAKQLVVLDTMGGAFTQSAALITVDAGHEVISVDDTLDPEYAGRDPNPAKDKNLERAIDVLRRSSADVAFALDGDGDRVIFIDQEGTVARPEQIAALLLRHSTTPYTIVHDLKCASLVTQMAEQTGGTAVIQPSGHGFIKRRLIELGAELGVEVSGHHFFGVLNGGDDALFTALVVLRLLGRRTGGLAAWLQEIGWPAITPDLRIEFQGDTTRLLEQIAAGCGAPVTRIDGIRAQYDSNGWALARASITEPAITLRFEGRDDQHVRDITRRFLSSVPELYQKVLERI